jgi:hypothetical protein
MLSVSDKPSTSLLRGSCRYVQSLPNLNAILFQEPFAFEGP